jgi:predicted transcriptional regulator
VLNAILSFDFSDLLDAWPANEISGSTLPSIKGNDGTIYGATPVSDNITAFGDTDVLSGDGVDDRVDLGNLQSSNDLRFTWECWFKTTQTGNDRWIISEGSTSSNVQIIGLINQNGKARAFVRDNSNASVQVIGNVTINDGGWHHLAMSFDNTTLRLFVDGNPDGTATGTLGTTTTNTTSLLCLKRAAIGQYVQGRIAEARIWNIARTKEQINETINERATDTTEGIEDYDTTTPYDTGTTNENGLTTLNYQINTIHGLEVTLPGKRRFIMPFKRTTRGLLDWQVMLSDYLATFATDRGNILINSEPENNDANFLIE